MHIKLIASDIDGTLIPYHGKVSERTRAAIRACTENRVLFTIATGRWFVTARAAAMDLGQTSGPMVIANGGAVVTMDGEILKEWTFSEVRAAEAYAMLARHGVAINAFTRGTVFHVNAAAGPWPIEASCSYENAKYRVFTDDAAAFEREGLHNLYKLEVYSDQPKLLQEIAEELTSAGFSVTSSHPINIEIVESGVSKGAAVQWLADQMHIAREECMAMGDYENDLTLLNAVGWPIAMSNGCDTLKAAARRIAPDSKEDGAAIMIERALEDQL